MQAYDVVVVGGGVAGLTAAAFAAKGGAGVRVLEGALACGGRARTRTVRGYHFNQGAHALYRGGFLDEILRDLGVALSGATPRLAAGVFVCDGRLHQAPFSAAGLAATTLLSDAQKGDLAQLFRQLVDGSTRTPPGVCLGDALAALSPSPKLRSVLAAMTRLTSLVHAPGEADGPALLEQLRAGLTRRVLYLDGGWAAVTEGLRSACLALGADVSVSCRVERLEGGPPWRVTLADGAAVTARAIVLAVGPAEAAALWPAIAELRPVTDARPACVACLDIGLAALPRPEALFALGVDRPLYFSVHSAAARLAPDGAALAHAVRYLEPGERPSPRELLAELEAFVELVQPGWRALEQARQWLPRMPAMSSIPLAALGGLHGRPAAVLDAADGLFIAGDWVGPVGLLADAAAASGRAVGEAAAALCLV